MVSSFLNKVHVGWFLEPESAGQGVEVGISYQPRGPPGGLSLSLSLSPGRLGAVVCKQPAASCTTSLLQLKTLPSLEIC